MYCARRLTPPFRYRSQVATCVEAYASCPFLRTRNRTAPGELAIERYLAHRQTVGRQAIRAEQSIARSSRGIVVDQTTGQIIDRRMKRALGIAVVLQSPPLPRSNSLLL